jgi:hypothetical protein
MTSAEATGGVDYFVTVARAVLDGPLAEHGFRYEGAHRGVTAYWTAGLRFFRVGYLAESSPDYELLIGVGRDEASPLSPKSATNSLGIWRLIPPELAPKLADWRFRDPQSLGEELARAWEEAVAPYALPILGDDEELSRAIEQSADEVADEDQRLMNQRLLRYARQTFGAGRFAEALSAYEQLPASELTGADLKRRAIARSRAGPA